MTTDSGPPAPSAVRWLIERRHDDRTFYLVAEHYGGLDWTEDPHKAQRFPAEHWARKLIARSILHVFDDLRVEEHMFLPEPEHEPIADRPLTEEPTPWTIAKARAWLLDLTWPTGATEAINTPKVRATARLLSELGAAHDVKDADLATLEALMRDTVCPINGCDNKGSIARTGSRGEVEQYQCRWCDERAKALAPRN